MRPIDADSVDFSSYSNTQKALANTPTLKGWQEFREIRPMTREEAREPLSMEEKIEIETFIAKGRETDSITVHPRTISAIVHMIYLTYLSGENKWH